MIYTFYSYKGGAGRSMAVANTAEWFCRQGLRVAMIDWDLEAPGLENFFLNEPDELSVVRSQLGVIDMLQDYKRQYPYLPLSPEMGTIEKKVAALRGCLPPLSAALYPIHKPKSESAPGAVWLLPAGWRDGERFATYALAVQAFDWAEFYAEFDGQAYFEWLRRELVEGDLVDIVLIDSRTGVTEMGGVCTRQLADVVVTFCVPNVQNLNGVEMMARSFRRPEILAARDNRPLEVIVVPTRIENSETDLRNDFEKRFKNVFEGDEVTPPALRRMGRSFWDLRIPYIPKYAYVERLAVGQKDAATDLVDAYDRLCRSLIALADADSKIVAKLGLDALPEASAQAQKVPFMAGNLPTAYVERSGLVETLAGALLTARDTRPVAGCVGLTGLPGAGKTTLALSACHDRRVRRVFVDGVLWVTLGKSPADPVQTITNLIHTATGQLVYFKDLEAAQTGLALALAEREFLLVIDDAWSAPALAPFLVGGSRCTRLVTTPDSAVLPPGTRPIFVDRMERVEAAKLLAAGLPAQAETDAGLVALAIQLYAWPLPLSLANRALADRGVKDGQSFGEAAEFLSRVIDQRGIVGVDSTQRADSGESVLETLVSLRRLVTEEQWARLAELVIFEPGATVPIATVARLWGVTSKFDEVATELLCNRLSQVNLVRLDSSTRPGGVALVDVLRSYLSHEQLDVASLHARFLDSYTAELMGKAWARAPRSETYLWRSLRWHLLSAGRDAEFRDLLLQWEWIWAKLEYVGIDSLIFDYTVPGAAQPWSRIRSVLMANRDVLGSDPDRLARIFVRELAGSDDEALRGLVEAARSHILQVPPEALPAHPSGARRDGVYISYRRRDTGEEATRLYEALRKQFGGVVFIDLASIAPGADFQQAIDAMLEQCGTMLVIIGQSFLSPLLGESQSSSAGSTDFMYREIEVALARDMRVIPVLVQGAVLPPPDGVPASIAGLFRRNAFEIELFRFDYDVGRLIEVLAPIVGSGPLPVEQRVPGSTAGSSSRENPQSPPPLSFARALDTLRRQLAWQLAVVLVFLLGVVLLVAFLTRGGG